MKFSNKILIVCAFALTACVGVNRFTKIVTNKLEEDKVQVLEPDYLLFNTNKLIPTLQSVNTTKVKSYFIPAVVFYSWLNILKCSINPIIRAQSFSKSIIDYCDSLNLKSKLKGKKIEIIYEKIPSTFQFEEKGYCVFVFIAYSVAGSEIIEPVYEELKITYRILENDVEIKSNTLIQPYKGKPLQNEISSHKAFTNRYLNQTNREINLMCKETVKKLIQELDH